MNKIDFSKYQFRASSLPAIMTKSRGSDPLSETTKAYLREIWIAEVFGREKEDIKNKFCDKGIACESDSLSLVEKVTKQTYFKNKKTFENEFIKGTPDVITANSVLDVKTSWNIFTYAGVDNEKAKKDYYLQVYGYMWLTQTKKSSLIYCLVNTPENIIQDEIYKASFRNPELGDNKEAEEKFRKNYIFDDIDPKLRMKKYDFEFDEELLDGLKEKIITARAYLNALSL